MSQHKQFKLLKGLNVTHPNSPEPNLTTNRPKRNYLEQGAYEVEGFHFISANTKNS